MQWDAVDLVVGGHHRPDLPFPYHCFKRRKQLLTQHPLGIVGRPGIGPGFGLAVGGEVLGGCDDMLRIAAECLTL